MKIILFEDCEQRAPILGRALKAALGDHDEVVVFAAHAAPVERMHHERLEAEITGQAHGDASLIVADRDLSRTGSYAGLSEQTVRKVADKLGIPECSYARGYDPQYGVIQGAEEREGRIAVSLRGGDQQFARHVASVAHGFALLRDGIPATVQSASGRRSPGRVLASLMGKPEYAEKIALYASGDQSRLESVLRVRGNDDERYRRLACLLGYWLWDSVLFYPGVLVNQVAASSYLNIAEASFRNTEVCSLFAEARYSGPFAEAVGPMWWRPMLDDIVANGDADNGREFVKGKLGHDIPQSQCCENAAEPAGYYCMLSGKPVSLKNSKGGLAWFPRGADLARICESKYAEVVPWL